MENSQFGLFVDPGVHWGSVYETLDVPFGDVSSSQNTSWYDITPIPEPAAGALLVLGLAVIGLKRKPA